MPKTRYVQVGLGDRSTLFTWAITQQYSDHSDLVAICDTNPGRVELRKMMLQDTGYEPDCYPAEDFDRMIIENKPDVVVVTTVNSLMTII